MCGVAEALSALWAVLRRWVAAVLLAYKPNHQDLEDLLQEVAMTLVSKVNTVRDEKNVRAWLRTVAINVARASARTSRSRPRLVGTDEVDALPAKSDSDGPARDESASKILELTLQLPEAYREPLILKTVHGMRSRQIARILGIPEATVDTRVSRARRMLRELVTGRFELTADALEG
jgi:RNA polymerase sigma-70 factor (ECF subfamily)